MSKPQSIGLTSEGDDFEVLHRGEITVDAVDLKREHDAKEKKVTSNIGFVSTTSSENVAQTFEAGTYVMFIRPKGISSMGQNIQKLSSRSSEREVLYAPGTQTAIVDYKKLDVGYRLWVMSEKEFSALSEHGKNRPILIVNESKPSQLGGKATMTYSLCGLKDEKYQLTTLKDFQISHGWKVSSLYEKRRYT